jgi:hypothetical protein
MDLDGDGVNDLVVGNQGGDARWFKGAGTAAFEKKDSVNSGGLPLTTTGNTALSKGYNTTLYELPFLIITNGNGNVYQADALLLGDVDTDKQVFLTDFSIFVDTWRYDTDSTGWRYDTNFDVSPNSTSNKQEIFLPDFSLFTDAWRKEQ